MRPGPPAGSTTCRSSTPTRRASRPAASGAVINAVAGVMPEFWAAPPTSRSRTTPRSRDAPSFPRTARPTSGPVTRTPAGCCTSGSEEAWARSSTASRSTAGPASSVARVLTFSDYMRGSVRLAALMGLPGHLRLDLRLHRSRRGRPDAPADRAPRRAARDPRARRRPTRDANETRRLERHPAEHRPPAGLALTRQNVPVFPAGSTATATPATSTAGRLRPARRRRGDRLT